MDTYTNFRAAVLAAAFGMCGAAHAIDGVVLIDQNRALAGNVTPGDAPGFPVTISQPGSYRLSGNLTLPDANTTAIVITVFNEAVTIDLNGFSIIGIVSFHAWRRIWQCGIAIICRNSVNRRTKWLTYFASLLWKCAA